MKVVEIEIYRTASGKQPYSDWLDRLEVGTRAIIRTRLNRIRVGNFGACKPIKGCWRMSEIIIDFGPGYRIYYGMSNDETIVILLGGLKRSQERDILKARQYWLDYKEKRDD